MSIEKKLPADVTRIQQLLMKKAEKDNIARVQKATLLRSRNVRVGGLIGAGVFGIYFYTMWAMKQEHILDFDDYDEKQKATA
ncbi:hypothetical protein HDE_09010 [Halotydeus destructor]|nr:hypothetical protein HDE_09010 [Halotydeus destructor]